MLAPALALLVVVLGALAVDRTAVLVDQRQLVTLAQAAAADAAALGVDEDALRSTGHLRYDRQAIHRSIARSLAAHPEVEARWSIDQRSLRLVLERPARVVFGPAIGGPRTQRVVARASAALALTGP